MHHVYLFLAPGFEEIEALTVVDLLRRANISITTVSITNEFNVTGAHNITITADILLSLICHKIIPTSSPKHAKIENSTLKELVAEVERYLA